MIQLNRELNRPLISLCILTLLLAFPMTGHAHFLGNDSVDGNEIRWGTSKGATGWTSARDHAISKWDALGTINIAPDTSTTVEDLSFRDVDRHDVAWSGRWIPLSGADVIEYNDYYFYDFTVDQRKHTALHEMGHALGLDHHNLSGNVMRSGFWSYTELGAHDKEDYYALWGR